MRWVAGVPYRVKPGVMALVSRSNRSVLGYRELLSAPKRIENFVLDVGRETKGK
jgi:hypothetical protein